MKAVIGSVILGIRLCLAGECVFLTGGGMRVSTKGGGPMPLERFIAKAALKSAIGPGVRQPSPITPDQENLVAGAQIYRAQCAVCHGDWGRPPSAIAMGMFPAPPQLLPPGKGVTDDPVGATHWKVKNGIRRTGMPGFGDTLHDTEIWQVSLLLLHAQELPIAAREALRPLAQQSVE